MASTYTLEDVVDELAVIFPHHSRPTITDIVHEAEDIWMDTEPQSRYELISYSSEQLASSPPDSNSDATSVWKEVESDLMSIFPDHPKNVIQASMDLAGFHNMDKTSFLERCINSLLSIVEKGSKSTGDQSKNTSSDTEDVTVVGTEDAKDVFITRTENLSSILVDDKKQKCKTSTESEQKVNLIREPSDTMASPSSADSKPSTQGEDSGSQKSSPWWRNWTERSDDDSPIRDPLDTEKAGTSSRNPNKGRLKSELTDPLHTLGLADSKVSPLQQTWSDLGPSDRDTNKINPELYSAKKFSKSESTNQSASSGDTRPAKSCKNEDAVLSLTNLGDWSEKNKSTSWSSDDDLDDPVVDKAISNKLLNYHREVKDQNEKLDIPPGSQKKTSLKSESTDPVVSLVKADVKPLHVDSDSQHSVQSLSILTDDSENSIDSSGLKAGGAVGSDPSKPSSTLKPKVKPESEDSRDSMQAVEQAYSNNSSEPFSLGSRPPSRSSSENSQDSLPSPPPIIKHAFDKLESCDSAMKDENATKDVSATKHDSAMEVDRNTKRTYGIEAKKSLNISPILYNCNSSPASVKRPPILSMNKTGKTVSRSSDEKASSARYRSQEFSDSDSEQNSNPAKDDDNDVALPVFKIKKRERSYEILSPAKLQMPKPGSSQPESYRNLSESGKNNTSNFYSTYDGAEQYPGATVLKIPQKPYSFKGLDKNNSNKSVDQLWQPDKAVKSPIKPARFIKPSVSQPTLTIESTHKITYSDGPDETSRHTPRITLSLSPKFLVDDSEAMDYEPGVHNNTKQNSLAAVARQDKNVKTTPRQYEKCAGCGGYYEFTLLPAHHMQCRSLKSNMPGNGSKADKHLRLNMPASMSEPTMRGDKTKSKSYIKPARFEDQSKTSESSKEHIKLSKTLDNSAKKVDVYDALLKQKIEAAERLAYASIKQEFDAAVKRSLQADSSDEQNTPDDKNVLLVKKETQPQEPLLDDAPPKLGAPDYGLTPPPVKQLHKDTPPLEDGAPQVLPVEQIPLPQPKQIVQEIPQHPPHGAPHQLGAQLQQEGAPKQEGAPTQPLQQGAPQHEGALLQLPQQAVPQQEDAPNQPPQQVVPQQEGAPLQPPQQAAPQQEGAPLQPPQQAAQQQEGARLKPTQQGPPREPLQTQVIQPPPTEAETFAAKLNAIKNEVLFLMPDVEDIYLERFVMKYLDQPDAANAICDYLFEHPDYPRKKKGVPVAGTSKEIVVDMNKNYYMPEKLMDVFPDLNDEMKYCRQAFQVLTLEFGWFQANFMRKIFEQMYERYAPTHRYLTAVWTKILANVKAGNDDVSASPNTLKRKLRSLNLEVEIEYCIHNPWESSSNGEKAKMHKVSVQLLKNRRTKGTINTSNLMHLIVQEMEFVQQKSQDTAKEVDLAVAMAMNEEEYAMEGQSIECGCCYGEFPFELMVQCYDGHLFCRTCLEQYARESVFGQGKADLKCMTDMCDSAFPKSQLERALPSDILTKYEDRVAEENLNMADLGDLVKCPKCDFRAFMDPDDKVFRCMHEKCMKESCRYCGIEWDEHFGKKCSEVEQKDETQLRLEYEEKMTKAKVRTCHRCKAQFMKETGCNKMTCRCGATMCYICRTPDINYKHFCGHPRDPGQDCTKCKACSLWTNPEEDDDRAVNEIQKTAIEERKKKGFSDEKTIGVPETQPPPKKKARI